MTIHAMVFKGYDMVRAYKPCTYGGLFTVMYHPETTYYNPFHQPDRPLVTLCMSIRSTIVLPYRVESYSKQMLIIFKPFKGYSDGYVEFNNIPRS